MNQGIHIITFFVLRGIRSELFFCLYIGVCHGVQRGQHLVEKGIM